MSCSTLRPSSPAATASEWDFHFKKEIRRWIFNLYKEIRATDPSLTKLLIVDTPQLDMTRFLVEEMEMQPKDLVVVNWDDGDLFIPAALMGCVFHTKRDVYTMTCSEVRSYKVAVAFLDVCGVGIPREGTTFRKSINPFRDVPIVVETHSVYASKYMPRENRKKILDDYAERHEKEYREGRCTQVVPYPGKAGNRTMMLLASSVLEGFEMEPFAFHLPPVVVEKKMPPTSAAAPAPLAATSATPANSGKRHRDDDGPPSKRTRIALPHSLASQGAATATKAKAVKRRPPGANPKGKRWDYTKGMWVSVA